MDIYRQEAARELITRRSCRQSIFSYVEFMLQMDQKPFLQDEPPLPFHKKVMHHLQRVGDGHCRKFMCSMPPSCGKSQYASVIFPTWLLCRDPKLRIICVSNSERVAGELSRMRRDVLLSDEWQRLSGSRLASDAKSVEHLRTDQGGYIYTLAAGAKLSGLRADVIIADDLVADPEEAASSLRMEKLLQWYRTVLRARKSTRYSQELIIGTRWSERDPIGYFLEAQEKDHEKGWEFLRLPLLADEDEDPMGRELGECLMPERWTPEDVKELQANPVEFKTVYQQRPAVERGGWVNPRHFQRVDYPPRPLDIYFGIDLATAIGRGDFTVIAVIGVDQNRNFYLMDMYRKQCSTSMAAEVYLELFQKYKPKCSFIDREMIADTWRNHVLFAAQKTGLNPQIVKIDVGGKDKETRNTWLRTALLNDRFHFCPGHWVTDVFEELERFPTGKHDDIVDALGLVAKQLPRVPGAKTTLEQSLRTNGLETLMVPHQGGFAVNSSLREMFEERERVTPRNKLRI